MSASALDLLTFIVEAKQSTYATGEKSKVQASRSGAKDFPYSNGLYSYLDSYFGELEFAGQEVVWREGKAIWAMNYYGYAIDPVDGFPEFLFACLRQASEEAPFRGPKRFSNERFEYICSWSGDVDRFSGEEKILHKGKAIFALSFHGGSVKYS